MSEPTREEIQAQIAAAEARGDTKIARLEGKLDQVLTKIDGVNEGLRGVRDDNRATRANQWVIAFGLALLIVAMATLFPVMFDMTNQLREMIHHEVETSVPAKSTTPGTN